MSRRKNVGKPMRCESVNSRGARGFLAMAVLQLMLLSGVALAQAAGVDVVGAELPARSSGVASLERSGPSSAAAAASAPDNFARSDSESAGGESGPLGSNAGSSQEGSTQNPGIAVSESDSTYIPPKGLPNGWYARVETSFGEIVIRLLPHQAPQSVAHFVGLADGTLPWMDPITGDEYTSPYYDGATVQKVVERQRFEAAERRADGVHSPTLYVPEEGAGPINFFKAYRVGMTRASGGRISAAQFFMTAAPQPFLTPRHPCFGEVMLGKDVVKKISSVNTYSNGRPIEDVLIKRVRTFKIGDPPPIPEPVPHFPTARSLELRKNKKTRD